MKILAALILLTLPASARLGETKDQCIARYGKPDAISDADATVFKKNEFFIIIRFFEGSADSINIRKFDSPASTRFGKLSDIEIKTLLEANGGGKKWVELDALGMSRQWKTQDENLSAWYSVMKGDLTVATKENLERNAKRMADEQQKALKGF